MYELLVDYAIDIECVFEYFTAFFFAKILRERIALVDKSYRNNITPYDIYPEFRPEKTLRDVIYEYPRLEWGEICKEDFYHAFRTYKPEMREWIHDLKEGESAFDNVDPAKRPHRVVDGKIVENIRKNRDSSENGY